MLLIYLSGSLLVIIIGYIYNRYGNFWLQLELGPVLLLALLSWFGVTIQILVGIAQVNTRWFLPKEKRWNE